MGEVLLSSRRARERVSEGGRKRETEREKGVSVAGPASENVDIPGARHRRGARVTAFFLVDWL